MKKVLLALVMVSSATAAYSSDFNLETIKGSDLGVKLEAVEVPVPAAIKAEAPVPQDLLPRFQQALNGLNSVRNSLTWVRNDIDSMETRVRRTIQLNTSDPFLSSEIRRMSMDMSRYFNDLQRAAADVHSLVGLAQKSDDLNRAARDMDLAARGILSDTWPTLENSAQRLESTVRSARPEQIGYDASWAVMDISRYARQLSDQARNASYDTQSLVSKTQP